MSMATVNGFRAMPSASTAEAGKPKSAGHDFAGLVLAGGQSSRMGRDKAGLSLNGISLLDHAVETLRDAGAHPVLVSGNHPGHQCIPDKYPGRGPLGGLASVISGRPTLAGSLLVVIPVDAPGLAAADLRRLAAGIEDAAGAHFEGHPLPMAVRVSDDLATRVEQLLGGTGIASVRRLAGQLDFRVLPRAQADLRNLNTPRDWDAFTGASP